MEGDHRQSPAGIKQRNGLFHDLFHGTQLIIYGNAYCLKTSLGGMLLFAQSRRRHCRADDIHQLKGRFDGIFFPATANGRRDLRRVTLFAVRVEDVL